MGGRHSKQEICFCHLDAIDTNASVKQRLQTLIARPSISHLWVMVSPSADVAANVARAFLLDWLGAASSVMWHPDLLELKTSGKIALHSVASVTNMLHQLSLTPHGSKGRAFLIEAADRMLPPTANALLKALEEPPPRTLIVLATASPHLLLPTILSRAHTMRLPGMPTDVPFDLADLIALVQRSQPIEYGMLSTACAAIQKALEKEKARLEKECAVKKVDGTELTAAAKQEIAAEAEGGMTLWAQMTGKQVLERVYEAMRGQRAAGSTEAVQRLLQAMNGIDRGADLSSMLLWLLSS